MNRLKGLMIHITDWVGDLQIIILVLLIDHNTTSRLSRLRLLLGGQVHRRLVTLLLNMFIVDVDGMVARQLAGCWLLDHLSRHLLVKIDLLDLLVGSAFQTARHLLPGM